MQIYTKYLSGKTLTLDVESSDTIENVKRKIEALEGPLSEHQVLFFTVLVELDDGSRTVADYNLEQGSIIFVITKTLAARRSTLYVESTPSLSRVFAHEDEEIGLVGLRDGSFVSFDCLDVKRWMISTDRSTGNKTLELVGTYPIHYVSCLLRIDDNTLITGDSDRMVKLWNLTTCQCLNSVTLTSDVTHLFRTKSDKPRFVCVLLDGTVEIRNTTDLSLVSSFDDPRKSFTRQLSDGTFISGCRDGGSVFIWGEYGTITQIFNGDSKYLYGAIELRSDLIVTSEDYNLKMWKRSTGECLRTLPQPTEVVFLEQISQHKFLSCSSDMRIAIWDDDGRCLEEFCLDRLETESLAAIAIVGDSLVTIVDNDLLRTSIKKIEIRRLRQVENKHTYKQTNKQIYKLSINPTPNPSYKSCYLTL